MSGASQKTKNVIGPLVNEFGEIVTDDLKMCDMINSFFSSVFTKETKEVPEVNMRFAANFSQRKCEEIAAELRQKIAKFAVN